MLFYVVLYIYFCAHVFPLNKQNEYNYILWHLTSLLFLCTNTAKHTWKTPKLNGSLVTIQTVKDLQKKAPSFIDFTNYSIYKCSEKGFSNRKTQGDT